MKNKILSVVFMLFASFMFAQQQNATFTLTPAQFNPDDQVTITVSGVNLSTWGVSDLYLWTWFYDLNDQNQQDSPTNGSWGNSDEAQKFTDNGDGTYSFTFIPQNLYGTSNIGSIGMLAKAKDGSGDKKTQDHFNGVLADVPDQVGVGKGAGAQPTAQHVKELVSIERFAQL